MAEPRGPVSTDAIARAVAAEVARVAPAARGQLSATLSREVAEVRAAWRLRPRLTVGGYAQWIWQAEPGEGHWRAAARADWTW